MLLNNEQNIAIKTVQGPVLLVDGAGTGKTTTLIERANYLVREKHVQQNKILLISFSKKTIRILKEKISLSDKSNELQIFTFHSFSYYILREFYRKSNIVLKIIDEAESAAIIKKA
jgi:DNA helicase-2/ATP-dependent DNA helicase PcrA